jgi:CBS domain containing-hemolysin-like protein
MPISEINDIIHVDFSVDEALTVGGLIISRLRHIPLQGDVIEEKGHRLTVVESDERSVVKVRIERLPG